MEDRFWSKVVKGDGCWIWAAAFRGHYGAFKTEGRVVDAHRVAYALAFGPIEGDDCIRHTCDNPKCVNPWHLLPGTQAQNVADMISRGRQWCQKLECCANGHPFTPENTRTTARGRICKVCVREYNRKRYADGNYHRNPLLKQSTQLQLC